MKKEIKLKNQVGELEHVAVFIEKICEELGLGMDLQMNLNLVLEEMVSNLERGCRRRCQSHRQGDWRHGYLDCEKYYESGDLPAIRWEKPADDEKRNIVT